MRAALQEQAAGYGFDLCRILQPESPAETGAAIACWHGQIMPEPVVTRHVFQRGPRTGIPDTIYRTEDSRPPQVATKSDTSKLKTPGPPRLPGRSRRCV